MLRPLARMLLQAVFRFQSRLLAAAQAVWKQLPAPGLGESGVATLQLILLSTLGGTTLLATAVLTETEDVLDQFADIVSAGVERVSGNLEVRGSIIATAPDNEIDTITPLAPPWQQSRLRPASLAARNFARSRPLHFLYLQPRQRRRRGPGTQLSCSSPHLIDHRCLA